MSFIFNLEMYSSVIKIALLVSTAVLLEIITPALGFNIANEEELFVETDPIKISVIINVTFFLFKLLETFFYYSLSILSLFKKRS